jgi:sulfur relay (sulfurtransferase) DsrC/TusE family protein
MWEALMGLAKTTAHYEPWSRIEVARGPFGRTRAEIEKAARTDDLWPLTDDHWKVIQFVRAYFRDNGTAPVMVRIARATGFRLRALEGLFPWGTVKTVLRLAGLTLPLDLQSGCPYNESDESAESRH